MYLPVLRHVRCRCICSSVALLLAVRHCIRSNVSMKTQSTAQPQSTPLFSYMFLFVHIANHTTILALFIDSISRTKQHLSPQILSPPPKHIPSFLHTHKHTHTGLEPSLRKLSTNTLGSCSSSGSAYVSCSSPSPFKLLKHDRKSFSA